MGDSDSNCRQEVNENSSAPGDAVLHIPEDAVSADLKADAAADGNESDFTRFNSRRLFPSTCCGNDDIDAACLSDDDAVFELPNGRKDMNTSWGPPPPFDDAAAPCLESAVSAREEVSEELSERRDAGGEMRGGGDGSMDAGAQMRKTNLNFVKTGSFGPTAVGQGFFGLYSSAAQKQCINASSKLFKRSCAPGAHAW